jgi:hypothetical protein
MLERVVARGATSGRGDVRARSPCRFVLPLIHFINSVPLFLKRQCDRTLGDDNEATAATTIARFNRVRAPRRRPSTLGIYDSTPSIASVVNV